MIMLISFALVALFNVSVDARYTGGREIKPSKADFTAAEKVAPKYLDSYYFKRSINGSVNLDYYNVNDAGAYNIYSLSNNDSVGTLFVKNSFLFIHNYDFVAEDDDSGTGLNFIIKTDLKSNKKYFVGSRVYGNNSGSYDVVFEKNLDKETSSLGGKWTQDTKYFAQNQKSAIVINHLTSEQVALYYEYLRQEIYFSIQQYARQGKQEEEIYQLLEVLVGLVGLLPMNVVMGTIYFALSSGVFQSISNNTSGIKKLGEIQSSIFEASEATAVVIGSSVTYNFRYGISEATYVYTEVPWWSWVLFPFGLIGGAQHPIEVSKQHISHLTQQANEINGLLLQRGTIQTF